MRWAWIVLAGALLQPAWAQAQADPKPPSAQPETPTVEASEAQAFPVAGKVELVEGDVLIINVGGGRRPTVDTPIYEGEAVHTGRDGEVHLRMEDGGLIAVRPGTRMSIAEFRAEGQDTDRMTIGLLEGGFRALTGWIARFNRASYKVRAPGVTIGVRGTDHEPFVIPEGSPLGEPGTYDKVNQGGTYIESAQGRIEVEPGRTAFAHLRRAERPRLLARAPGFFRGGRHEARITQHYQQIQQRLEEHREQRRQRFQERRSEREATQAKRREQLERDRAGREARGQQLEERRGDRQAVPQERRRERLEREPVERRQRLDERRGERETRKPAGGERGGNMQERPQRGERERPQRGRER